MPPWNDAALRTAESHDSNAFVSSHTVYSDDS